MIAALVGAQAQDLPAARLSVRARTSEPTDATVEAARVEERSLVHTWAMRGTLHLLPSRDLAWLLPLLGPMFLAAGRGRRAQLGLEEKTLRTGVEVIRAALAQRGPLTRQELAPGLEARGVPTAGQALIHMIQYAALGGVVCAGPLRRGKPTYALLEDWGIRLQPLGRAEVLARLAERYLEGYGPAGPEDFAAWSGLPLRDARLGWERMAPAAIAVEASGRRLWLAASRAAWLDEPLPQEPVVKLLPRFDTYLLGYSGRDWAAHPDQARRVNTGGGMVHASLLVDGQARGVWKTQRKKGMLEVHLAPFGRLSAAVRRQVREEVLDLGRFLDTRTAMGKA